MIESNSLSQLNAEIISCTRCPRLTAWRNEVARQKRKAYMNWEYWGKPVPGFGDPNAQVLVVGLAPGAHGSNRTGRMFTGDGSGDFLYPALFKAGFANQPDAKKLDDGLRLSNIYITAVCRCAPPANKPTTEEMDLCQPFLVREIILVDPKIYVAFGRIAYERILRLFSVRPQNMKFGHGAIHTLDEQHKLVCSYHPSRQNTQTGRLTREMFDQIWMIVRDLLCQE
jgi:uracil-DNA glycosylase family 4